MTSKKNYKADIQKENILPKTFTLPVIVLKELQIYPGISVSFDVTGDEHLNALRSAQKNNGEIFIFTGDINDEDIESRELEIESAGCISKIRQYIEIPGGEGTRVLVEGTNRGKILEILSTEPYMVAKIELMLNKINEEDVSMAKAQRRIILKSIEIYGKTSGNISPDMLAALKRIPSLSLLTDTIANNLHIQGEIRNLILRMTDELERAKFIQEIIEQEIEISVLEKNLQEKVRESIDKGQKDYFLREQVKVIQEELGDKTGTVEEIEKYKATVEKMSCDEQTKAKLLREIQRLSLQPQGSPEGTQIKMYLDTVFELPWGKTTKDMLSIAKASKIINRDHYGLEKVKERILEFLAIRKIKSDQGIPDIKGPILCLVGPPGVGKTSIAKSLAEAIGRKYIRMSLGGVHDEAEIRGHRRTYIGSMPGRFIQAIRQAGTDNPLILLDEVDKLGKDYRGDPSSALLEVLDSEQNSTFRDHYLEIPYDLSQVLFITTANTWESIPQALTDRMEFVFLSGYTEEEKIEIGMRHIVNKTIKDNGLNKSIVSFTKSGVRDIIRYYTRESGVRELERQIAKVCRKSAIKYIENDGEGTKVTAKSLGSILGKPLYRHDIAFSQDQVGIATGLAWTSVGGDTLSIEVELMEGTGKIELTGQLGNVMRESAKIAISYVRTCSTKFGVDSNFKAKTDIHVHVPAGAIPKDGPSAGITLATALVSAVTKRPVKHDLAMTGELTLRGRVLPVGGIKEKLIAAVRAGIKKVIIPAENNKDLDELPDSVLTKLEIIEVKTIDEVLKIALSNIK